MPGWSFEQAAQYVSQLWLNMVCLQPLAALSQYEDLKAQAVKSWHTAAAGWRPTSKGYQAKKTKARGGKISGVLSGAWRDYRTLQAAEYQVRAQAGGVLSLTPWPVDLTAPQATKRKRAGDSRPSQKPWRTYPGRPFDLPPRDFFKIRPFSLDVAQAESYRAAAGSLPLSAAMCKRMMARKGRGELVATAKKGRLKFKGRYGRAAGKVITL